MPYTPGMRPTKNTADVIPLLTAVPLAFERQTDEPVQAFRAFACYRDMYPNRSTSKVAAKLTLKHNTVLGYSQKYRWVSRATAWDNELDRRILERQTEAIVEMRERHIALSLELQEAAAKEVKALLFKIDEALAAAQESGRPLHEPILSPADLRRMIDFSTRMERLNRGEPTAHLGTEDMGMREEMEEARLANLSLEEKKQLLQLKRKALGVVEDPAGQQEDLDSEAGA